MGLAAVTNRLPFANPGEQRSVDEKLPIGVLVLLDNGNGVQKTTFYQAAEHAALRSSMHAGPLLEFSVLDSCVSFLGKQPLHRLALWDASHEVGKEKQRFDRCSSALSNVLKYFSGNRLAMGNSSLVPIGVTGDLQTGKELVEVVAGSLDLRVTQPPIAFAVGVAVENPGEVQVLAVGVLGGVFQASGEDADFVASEVAPSISLQQCSELSCFHLGVTTLKLPIANVFFCSSLSCHDSPFEWPDHQSSGKPVLYDLSRLTVDYACRILLLSA